MVIRITERLISHLWQSHLVRHAVADTGQWIHIVFPGRVSNRSGCDFSDAVININGLAVCGDVEVHVKSSQWQSHRHHQDPKYNNIVLHVVWEQDINAATRLQNGKYIPTVCLGSLIFQPLDELVSLPSSSSACPVAGRHSNDAVLSTLLTAAGLKRFRAKVASFDKALNKEDAGQVIYQGIARALGYTQNAPQFQELAQRLPVTQLIENAGPIPDVALKALLLGHAGLLPSQRARPIKDSEAIRLEKIWRSFRISETMKETDWCFFRVRPDNFPTRRLVALSILLSRYGQSGLSQGILGLVEKAPEHNGHCWLENGLVAAASGFWRNHFDFGVSTSRDSALIGREKASAVILNTVLPFAAAFGRWNSDSRLKKQATEIYAGYPARGDNELTRYMKQQLRLEPNIRLSACQQQGLIHLFHAYCRRRNCLQCPVAF